MITNLTKDNIKLYAASIYENPCCSTMEEFEEDYLKVKYLKVLINRLLGNKETNYRIILNHIICMSNVFPKDGTAKILFTEFEEDSWGVITVFLGFLNLLPEKIPGINGKTIYSCNLPFDKNLLERLQSL